jgi:GH15 family glucan-1,4-alpha-glucosidase
VGEVIDFMPVSRISGGPAEKEARQIVRIARAVRGELPFRFECRPGFDYARTPHEISSRGHAVLFTGGHEKLFVGGNGQLHPEGDAAISDLKLSENNSAAFILRYHDDHTDPAAERRQTPDELLGETLRFWRQWVSRSRYQGRWREMVTRSALVLKLLTYQPTGAILAAPTTSLPEQIGGVRNWDYRYTWIRDAAFSVYALLRLGFDEEAEAFASFVQARAKQEELSDDGPLNVLYPIAESGDTAEVTLDHLDGYKGSKPVRIGNAAAGHFQLDIYGELIDSLYLANKYASPISWDMWEQIERMLDWVSKNWDRPDRSIWEVRGDMQKFTYSRLQSWVALDRGIRIARRRSFPSDMSLWFTERDRIYRTIMNEAWNDGVRAFTQFPGSDAVDASALLMPLMKFIAPQDPRMLLTLDAVFQDLVSDTLVQRYQIGQAAHDGLPGYEGTFSVCSFWLVEAIARAGRLEQAQLLFEKMLTYANPLGLFSEEIGPAGESLGNFPQAFTHLGLISAAVNLNDLLDGGGASRAGGWFGGRGGRGGGGQQD